MADTNFVGDDVINNQNANTTNNIKQVDRREVDIQRGSNNTTTNFYQPITREAIQHADIPALPAPAAPDSVPVLSLYTQYTEGAGITSGAAISIPLNNL
tara:strand:- start:2492 stop:2788 length:297 start_codon:yes stop_codon:yes gene_type:complete